MAIVFLNDDIRQAIREAYWKDLMHLCQLGFTELTPDGKGVVITPKGRAYFIQTRHIENGDGK